MDADLGVVEGLAEAVQAAEEEARRAKLALERIAAGNVRIALALARERGLTEPTPFDPGPIFELASRATGVPVEELRAAAAASEPDEPVPRPPPDPRQLARDRARRAGVPELHIRHLLDAEPERSDALVAVERFMGDESAGFLVLSGGKGVHKTGSASWALGQREGLYVEAADLLAIAIEDKARYLALRAARLVVLDDLGTEVADDKGYWLRTFSQLWNGWYAGCAKVIATTNLTAAEFGALYGERVIDRVVERGSFVEVAGASRRRPRGAP